MRLYDELSEYTGRDLDLVRLRCQYAAYELAWQWEQSKHNPVEFYRSTDLYQYELTEYQTRLHAAGWHKWLDHILKQRQIKHIIDFGGGIGEASITASVAGVNQIDFCEVRNSPTEQYARWRFDKRKIEVQFFPESDPPSRCADLIIAMDVLEHLPNPEKYLRRFAETAPLLIANPEQVNINKYCPMHISKVDVRGLYDHVEGNLWKAKR